MKITEIYIKGFGKLRGVKITPVDGVNIIYGENEAGKSTVMAFLLAMLYGLGKGEQRRRYDPWAGGRMCGILSFEHNGKEYVLNRQFGVTKAADKTELWCKTSGDLVELPQRDEPGEYLLGINRETFLNSVFIGQAGAPINGDNNEILSKLTNLAASGDETASRTEISERLAEASAALRSRRATAIIPNLDKQRLELLEERSMIMKRAAEADTLREDVTRLTKRKQRLEQELSDMETSNGVLNDHKRLAELGELIQRKTQLDASREEYEKLHNALFSGGGLSQEFIEEVRENLDDYNSQLAVIKTKREQLESIEDRLRDADRASQRKLKVVKKYADEIRDARNSYIPLLQQKKELERRLENDAGTVKESKLNLQTIIIVAAALAVIFFLVGLAVPVFFIFSALVVLITAAYIFVQKKGISFEGLPKGNVELQNINDELRNINRSVRYILEEMDVANIEELDRALHDISGERERINSVEREKDALLNDIAAEKDRLEAIMQLLKDKIYPYMSVESNDDVLRIIKKLGRAQSDHAALEARYNAESDAFTAMLGDRDFDELCAEADKLAQKLGDSAMPEMDPKLADNIDDCRGEIQAVSEELIQKETALGMQNSDPQDLNKINDSIKTLSGRIDQYEFEYSALQEASDALDAAFESMQKDFGPMINFRAGKIVEKLTGEKYSSVVISESLVPSVAEPGGGSIRSCHSLSAGTVDQIYLALRLAIAGILTEENLPILLDDAFAQFDDKRMTDALGYLGAENKAGRLGQIILFTCHDRLLFAAKEVGMTDGIVRLK